MTRCAADHFVIKYL